MQNLTNDYEKRWMKLIFDVLQQSNIPKDYYNVAILVLLLSLIFMLTVRFAVKRFQRIRAAL